MATFGIASPNGVPVPANPPTNLPRQDQVSVARRSPQVRFAQATGSTRPDLVGRVFASDVTGR